MNLAGLFIYPVKSLRGFAVEAANLDALGLEGDRRFLVVDQKGVQLTQRVLPAMALIETRLTADELVLSVPHAGPCVVPRRGPTDMTLRSVSVWKSIGMKAEDCGDDSASWLTSFLGVDCRLVRIGEQFHRPVLDRTKAKSKDLLTFADAYPLLVITASSVRALNDRIVRQGGEPVPTNRFRPNLVVEDCPEFAEDNWSRLKIGSVELRSGGPCGRCIVTTTDQLTGQRGTEPLRTLAGFRRDARDPTQINFGLNLIHETKSGILRQGDLVTLC